MGSWSCMCLHVEIPASLLILLSSPVYHTSLIYLPKSGIPTVRQPLLLPFVIGILNKTMKPGSFLCSAHGGSGVRHA